MSLRNIIVIGASAGGVEALIELVSAFPRQADMSVFVVLHIPAEGPSVLPAILRRHAWLNTVRPTSDDPIEPGTIYVAPPNCHMLIKRDVVRLAQGPRENGHRPAIDPLFRSAAAAYGTRVIGVVLSGNLDDGTAGLIAIKKAGGLAVVQSPEEALYSGMPQSAIENAEVDYILPIAEIGPTLVRLAAESVPAASAPEDDPMRDQEIDIAEHELDHREPTLGSPSGFTCPECHGALWEVRDGKLVRYRCRVGHAYSPNTLIADSGKHVETALWIALRALEENAALARRLASRATERHMAHMAERYDRQSAEVEEQAQVIRKVLTQEHWDAPDTLAIP